VRSSKGLFLILDSRLSFNFGSQIKNKKFLLKLVNESGILILRVFFFYIVVTVLPKEETEERRVKENKKEGEEKENEREEI